MRYLAILSLAGWLTGCTAAQIASTSATVSNDVSAPCAIVNTVCKAATGVIALGTGLAVSTVGVAATVVPAPPPAPAK